MDLGAAWVCTKGFFDREGPHPIRPLKIYYIQLLLMLHTYILMGCHLGCLRRPRNLCVLDATWISKFRNPSGIEDTKLRPGAKKKFWPCTSLGGVRKNGQHHPLWRGQCCGCAGTCPRRPTENWAASPPLEGAMLHLRGYMPPEANEKSGSITPFCRGKDAAR